MTQPARLSSYANVTVTGVPGGTIDFAGGSWPDAVKDASGWAGEAVISNFAAFSN